MCLIVAVLRGEDTINALTMRYSAEVTQFFLNNQIAAAFMLLQPEDNAPNKTETIRYLLQHYPNTNVSKLASAIVVNQSWLSGIKNGRK
jgi:hypothetical protein